MTVHPANPRCAQESLESTKLRINALHVNLINQTKHGNKNINLIMGFLSTPSFVKLVKHYKQNSIYQNFMYPYKQVNRWCMFQVSCQGLWFPSLSILPSTPLSQNLKICIFHSPPKSIILFPSGHHAFSTYMGSKCG